MVATAVGGVPDVVVDGETGTLVPPAAPERLAEALLALLRDPARRAAMGVAGALRARSHFHASAVVQRIQSLYDDFLARRRN
jgi:glycosyltransferase involved in cell wall biosynthesis